MEQNQTKKWYDNKFVVHLLLVIFFPVGLYALWKTDTIAKWWKITATVLIGLIVIANLGDDDKTSTNSNNKSTTVVDNWYEGGTLHKAKISDWKTATEKNKLATCGDFMATVDNTVTLTELKRRATELKNCIDEATRDLESTNNESVSSIASLCIITMGY